LAFTDQAITGAVPVSATTTIRIRRSRSADHGGSITDHDQAISAGASA
jgi:hypothetical protein